MEKKSPRIIVSFLIVNYESEDALRRCLHDLRFVCENFEYEVLVGNNAKEELIIQGSDVTVVENGENKGFGTAHNALSLMARGEVLCILNPDVYNFDKSFLQLVKIASDERYGIVAPTIYDENGDVQAWSYGRVITPLSIIKNNLLSPDSVEVLGDRQSVGWVTGATFLIRKNLFEEVGGFDENFFLYFEDADLCRRVRKASFDIVRIAAHSVTHTCGASSYNKVAQKQQYFVAQKYYLGKYYGPTIATIMSLLARITHKI